MKLRSSLTVMQLEDHQIAFVDDSSKTYCLQMDKNAFSILELLKEETSIENVVHQLQYKFSNTEEELTAYVKSIVYQLAEKNLIERDIAE